MHEPWLSHISMGDPCRVLAFLFPHSRGLKPTATHGMPLQGMKQSLITSFLFNNFEIRNRTYEILYSVLPFVGSVPNQETPLQPSPLTARESFPPLRGASEGRCRSGICYRIHEMLY